MHTLASKRRPSFIVGGHEVLPGRKARLELPIARLMSGTAIELPVIVVHGRTDGPVVWGRNHPQSHGTCGREVLEWHVARVPIVNVHGFNSGDRYLPDRRDLNRSFPGSARGSLAARIAHLMMTEIVAKSTLGIDLHTGSSHRTNLPQIRANLDDAETFRLAKVFGAQIAIHSQTRDGSLRQAGTEAGATVLLYEAGEAYRFDELSIRVGTEGVLRVLGDVGMVEARPLTQSGMGVSRSTRWLRAGKSGIVHIDVDLGEAVESGSVVARVFDPFGKVLGRVRSPIDGVVIGLSRLPLVNRGDALLHIAELSSGAVPESEGS